MKILYDLAVRLGITRAEMTAVTLLTLFLLLGGALKYSGAMQEADQAIRKAETASFSEAEVDSLLSLAMKDRTPAQQDGNDLAPVIDTEEEAAPTRTKTGRSAKKRLTGPIAFSTASAAQLQMIPGVGPVMAKRLIEFRREKGGKVTRFNDFLEVKGIGKKKLELLQQHLTID